MIKANLLNEFGNLWNEYVDYTAENVYEELGNFNNIEEVYNSKELQNVIENDLRGFGFTEEECKLLSSDNGIRDTKMLYKALAFLLSMDNHFETVTELGEVIRNHGITNIEHYTNEDLENILNALRDV